MHDAWASEPEASDKRRRDVIRPLPPPKSSTTQTGDLFTDSPDFTSTGKVGSPPPPPLPAPEPTRHEGQQAPDFGVRQVESLFQQRCRPLFDRFARTADPARDARGILVIKGADLVDRQTVEVVEAEHVAFLARELLHGGFERLLE